MKRTFLFFAGILLSGLFSFSQETDYITDIDGNVYKTVKIGDQVWMAENLRVTRYRNGDPIPNITNYKEWSKDTLGAYCDPNNYSKNAAVYGRLYNYYAASDPRGLAPEGWHIATKNEWRALELSFGFNHIEGLYLQEFSSDFWEKSLQNIDAVTWSRLILETYDTSNFKFVYPLDIDHITLIDQKYKEIDRYELNWGMTPKYKLVPTKSSFTIEYVPPVFKLVSVTPTEKQKTEQRTYIISWNDDKREDDTIYWNKELRIADIYTWYFVKNAANKSGYTAIPCGYRSSMGDFTVIDLQTGAKSSYWMSVKPEKPDYVAFFSLCDKCFSLYNDMFAFKRKSFGLGIRCVKDY